MVWRLRGPMLALVFVSVGYSCCSPVPCGDSSASWLSCELTAFAGWTAARWAAAAHKELRWLAGTGKSKRPTCRSKVIRKTSFKMAT